MKKTKTKTALILETLMEEQYTRAPQKEILQMTEKEAKTIIIARYGMLECGKNFKGTMGIKCNLCNVQDDENHRLNHCAKWKDRNLFNSNEKVDFQNVHSNDILNLKAVIPHIQTLWNVKNAHGTMQTD